MKILKDKYDPELGVDSRCFVHNFATQGFPEIDKNKQDIIDKLKDAGHEIYSEKQISNNTVYIKPAEEPEQEVSAPLIELWIGEIKNEAQELGTYTAKAYSKKQIDKNISEVEQVCQSTFIDQDKYNEMKDKMVWIRYCYADSNIMAYGERKKSRVEMEPMLAKFGDAISLKNRTEEWEVYDSKLGVDSRCFAHNFATQGFPTVEKIQKGILREIKDMGYNVYERRELLGDLACVEPIGNPEQEVEAPLIELWVGDIINETKNIGMYKGNAYSEQQIKKAIEDIENVRQKLGTREIVTKKEDTEENRDTSFDSICNTLGLEEGEIVWNKYYDKNYKFQYAEIKRVVKERKWRI